MAFASEKVLWRVPPTVLYLCIPSLVPSKILGLLDKMSNFRFILLGCLVRNGGGRSPSFLLLSYRCPPSVCGSLSRSFEVFWNMWRVLPNALWKESPKLLFAFDLSPNIFTLVSQFLHFSGVFDTGFRKGFWICLIVEWHTHKESNAPIHLHSTEKDQSCSVAIVGVFFELVCVALASRCWPIETSRTGASSKLLGPV